MKIKVFGILMLTMILGACSSKSDSGNAGTKTDVPPNPYQVFDYDQFLFGTKGECGTEAFYFRYLSSDNVVIGQRDGQDIMVQAQIQLYRDQRYQVEITEKYISSYVTL